MENVSMSQRIAAGAIAFVGIIGGYGAYQGQQLGRNPDARPDPFTGTEARQMMRDLVERDKEVISSHNDDIKRINDWMRETERRIRELEACRARVEQQLIEINRGQERMLGILESTHPRGRGRGRRE